MLLQLSQFFLLCLPPPSTPHSFRQSLQLSSRPWVMHVSSLASPFLMLYFTSPWVFYNYLFVLLNPCTFSPILLLPPPNCNPPKDLHFCGSVPVLLVCLVRVLDSIFNSCEFIVILMFIVLIFFFLNMFL